MLRIIGGELRSRQLQTPTGKDRTRPMGSRTREAIFNVLRGWFDGANVLDLFAGVGTMGLEAASRGASKVWLVEQDRDVFELLRGNIEELGLAGCAVPVKADALGETALATVDQSLDVVFLDPPFEMVRTTEGLDRVLTQARRVRSRMKPTSFLVLRLPEIEGDGPRIDGFDGPEHRRYGNEQHVMLYCPSKEKS
ncbi:MAG: 16S rRNA (guanine(966)-N(2))-methyltransferase RsmD [Planctomycetes bacterium]|nr:16S rRNA (guanine(966)-N(2))-methyltransferase RsmD [Planctomycetota bacterium]